MAADRGAERSGQVGSGHPVAPLSQTGNMQELRPRHGSSGAASTSPPPPSYILQAPHQGLSGACCRLLLPQHPSLCWDACCAVGNSTEEGTRCSFGTFPCFLVPPG